MISLLKEEEEGRLRSKLVEEALRKKPASPTLVSLIGTIFVLFACLWCVWDLTAKAWGRQRKDTESERCEVPRPEPPLVGGSLVSADVPDKKILVGDEVNDEYASRLNKHGYLEPLIRSLQILNPKVWYSAMKSFFFKAKEFSKKPCWETVSDQMDPEHKVTERPIRLCPAAKDAKDNDLRVTHGIMGASCLVFVLPSVLALYLCQTGQATHCGGFTIALNVFLCYVSAVSFGADYWYTGDTPKSESYGIGEYKKQWIANSIDLLNVPIIATVCVMTASVLYLLSPGMNWAYPVCGLLFASGAGVQLYSLKVLKRYTDRVYSPGYDTSKQDPQAKKDLRTYLWLHTTWHLLAVIAPLSIVYGLMVYGVNVPACF